ncbi:MAG: hypothetical protein H6658_18635 [Ardenticatenaceae bacterium]|nr:hypothetical protein [Ardenticatenaceae bacterium]
MSSQKYVAAFGEVMMRLTPPGFVRVRRRIRLRCCMGHGGECGDFAGAFWGAGGDGDAAAGE